MSTATSLAAVKQSGDLTSGPDTKVDMFSARGFALAQRIANAFASSDAVPAQFRSHNLKRESNGAENWVPNQSALGNCIVAIEVAQAVGMSVTAVMQNADVIEGKLRWSGKFVIAAINASRRFTPLRFDIQNLGRIKASYKEKGSWNKELRRYDMTEKTVEVENLQCIAWAIPAGVQMPPGVYTLAQAREAKLPVIESAPVSIKMAVEEGWYSKAGSKWQTELKHLMLQYRAGTFFGNIHAPDIVMGMGRTVEEERDIIDITPEGAVVSITPASLRERNGSQAKVVNQGPADTVVADPVTAEVISTSGNEATGAQEAQPAQSQHQHSVPTVADALSFVNQGDYDMARDIARSLGHEWLEHIEKAIASRDAGQQEQPQQSGGRRNRGANLE
jgi:hypothetical protein